MKCKMCGTSFVPGENKFCEGCGMELPMVAAETVAPKAVPENYDEFPAAGTSPSTAIGKNSILSNSNINTTNTTTTTNVNNTTIEDDTKKSIVCAVSGKRVLYIESVCCRGCDKDVSLEYYNETTRRCENCHKGYLNQYRDAFSQSMSTGGIDRHERAQLDILANSLHISENEKLQIEQDIKNSYVTKTNSDFSELDDLYELDFMDAKKDILIKNDLSSALLKLKQIYDQVQTNDEVSCLYFLIKALKNPTTYITNYEVKSFEDYWENYWYFLAQLTNGDKQRKGFGSFRQNLNKYDHKKDEILLSESLYFIVAYQNTKNENYIEKANEKLVEIDSINSSFLLKLYKSTKHIILNFDPVDQKFINLTPPDEPGMREYFLFFLNHLYKIVPEVPKADNLNTKSTPPFQNSNSNVEPKEHIAPAPPKLPSKPTEVVPNQNSSASKSVAPQLPTLPPLPKVNISPAVNKPKMPDLPAANKTSGSSPKLPQMPTLPTVPVTPKVNLPKVPPVPGKK